MSIRKYSALILLILSMTAVFVLSCSLPARLPVLGKNDVVLAFGDSITFGTGALPQESYPAVLEKTIGRRVVNAGVPGDVSADGLARLPEILEREKPLIVIICLGGNDFLRRLNKKETGDNIRQMIHLTRQKGAAAVLIAAPALGLSVSPAPLYREIAKELTVPLEEKTLSDIWSDGSLKSDLIHPNAAGYRRLAESVVALLKKSGAIDQ